MRDTRCAIVCAPPIPHKLSAYRLNKPRNAFSQAWQWSRIVNCLLSYSSFYGILSFVGEQRKRTTKKFPFPETSSRSSKASRSRSANSEPIEFLESTRPPDILRKRRILRLIGDLRALEIRSIYGTARYKLCRVKVNAAINQESRYQRESLTIRNFPR